MANKIITIGRQFGSNGRIIGNKVAKELGIKCYDKKLIKEVAKDSGLWEDLLENLDEKPTNSFLYSVVMDPYAFAYSFDNNSIGMNLNQKAFMATYNTIKRIASDESCVFIGRCSNYVLKDEPGALHVFIYADEQDRISRVMKRYPELTEKKARDQIIKEDKARSSYYNFYTSVKWGDPASYDLCINTSKIKTDDAVDLILSAAEKV